MTMMIFGNDTCDIAVNLFYENCPDHDADVRTILMMIINLFCDDNFDDKNYDICDICDDDNGCARNGTPRYLGSPSAHAAKQR